MNPAAEEHHKERPTNVRALAAAWLGWAFDGLDGYLYVMVAIPVVTSLVAREHGVSIEAASGERGAEIASKATIIQAVFLFGWAIGGAVFGRIGDRLGRSRTLTFTILTYAIFTGMSFFATHWAHLLVFRFLAALGIGGEWAAGSALVSETLNPRHRVWASAFLQSGYILGCIGAALTAGLFAGHDPRWVFLVGVLPAFVVVWIRHSVPEPEEWANATREPEAPKVADLFAPGLRRTTIALLLHISITLTVVWAFLFFTPQMVSAMPEAKGWSAAQVAEFKTRLTVVFLTVNIVANFFATYLARVIGHRWAFFVMIAGALASVLWGFRTPPTAGDIYLKACLVSFTGLGLFAMFPLYVPPLFPTLLRTLGAGLTYNAGRVVAAVGTLFAGTLTANAGGPSGAMWWIGWLYVPGLVVCLFLPELARSNGAGTAGVRRGA